MSIADLAAQLTAMREELEESNDRAERMARLEEAMRMNAWTYRNSPIVVRDYQNDTVGIVCGSTKTFGGVK